MKNTEKPITDFNVFSYDYFFFDCDGVILDSVNIKTEAFKEIYKQFGAEVVKKVEHHHLANGGMSRFDKFIFYHREFLGVDLSETDVKKLAYDFSRIVFEKVLAAKYIDGAIEFLELCKKNEKECFVVSGTPENELSSIFKKRGLQKYFSEVKGSPQKKEVNVHSLVEKRKIDSQKAVFFGDSKSDLLAAVANKIKFVAVNFPGLESSVKNFKEFLNNQAGNV